MKEFLLSLSLLFLVSTVNATYVYEANQDLYDLQTNSSGATGLGSNDDSVSAAFDLGFTFTFYGNDFTKARMATNGCLHFNLTGSYCGDYTPDPLPQYTNTLFPFWTDLIKDNGSAMKAKAFEDYTIFGWYKMREYNRSGSDNSIEVWLYPNNTFEYRYGELDIKTHDVLIGEQGPTTSDTYTYLFFDECNTGTTNQSGCKNYDWNSSSNTYNTLLENGGSLYGIGAGNALDCSSPLNNPACAGYAAAYLTQQCGIDALYSETCTLYWEAYDDLQCSLDAQYAPFCPNYTSEDSVAYYYEDETDYGYEDDYYDDQYGYTDDDYYDDVYGFEDDYQDEYYAYDDDPYANMEFTDEEWYEIDLVEFGQEQVDEWYGTETSFTDEGYIEWDNTTLEDWDDLDMQMDEYDEFVEIYEDNYYEDEIFIEDIYEEVYQEETYYSEPFIEEIYEEVYHEETVAYIDYERISDYDLYASDTLLDEFLFLENINQIERYDEEEEFLEFESYEELEEWYEEEMEEEYQEEVMMEEEYEEEFEEIFEEVMEEVVEEEFEEEYLAEETFEEEAVEEIFEELEELREEERVAEETEESIDEITEERVAQEESKSGIRQEQLNVVASTVQTATNSMSGTTSGTSMYATGNTIASGGASSSMSGTIQSTTSSTGGMSMSSSPSISAQVQSAAIQTQTVLEMSPATASTGSMSFDTGSMASTTTASVVDTGSVVSNTSINTSSSFSDSSSTSTSEDASSQQDTQQDTQSAESSTTETVVASTDSSSGTSSMSTSSVTMDSMDTGTPVIVVDVQVQDMQNEINTAIGGEMTASEADTVADQIIAQNIESQQEALEEEQQETGEYADSTTLIAYMGYVPGFDAYKQVSLPVATSWYESKDIYTYVSIQDNNTAFFGLYGESMQGMTKLINLQPNL